jgi:thiamine pyrophosphokinase
VRALILSGGDAPSRAALDAARPGWRDADLVIGADSGARHAAGLGLPLHRVVGDFDSLSAAEVAAFAAAGAVIERHPVDKDATDTELALIAALDAGATQISILATWGRRADHALGTATLLTHPRLAAAGATAELLDAASRIRLLQGDAVLRLELAPGTIVSLIPWGGDAVVSASGLQWPLEQETLRAGASRGISNVSVEPTVEIQLHRGALLVADGGVE